MQHKVGVVPRLRFSEFCGDWKPMMVSDFFDQSTKPDKAAAFDGSKILTVRLYGNGVVKNKRTTLTGGANYFTRRAGQFIFSKIDLLNGAFGIVPQALDGFVSSSDVPAYSFNANHSSTFFVNWLKATYSRLVIERTGTSSTLKRISPEKFLTLELVAPSFPEQQKIADCLTSLDNVIVAQARKVETSRIHKRGLMQMLFPADGETAPRLRFPEFRDSGEWKERQLDKSFSHIRNGFVGTATPFYVQSGGIPYLQGKNVKKGRIDPAGLVTIAPSFHAKQVKSHLQRGDIVMVQSGHVGECALVEKEYVGANCHALIIMTPVTNCCPPFFVQYFGSDAGKRAIAQITTGNTIKHILASGMKSLVVRVPHLEEQKRIADCLTCLDEAVAAESQKLVLLKAHRRGLMQQIFASHEKA